MTIPRQVDFPTILGPARYEQVDFPTTPGPDQYGFAESNTTQMVIDLGGIDSVNTTESLAKGYVLWLEHDTLI